MDLTDEQCDAIRLAVRRGLHPLTKYVERERAIVRAAYAAGRESALSTLPWYCECGARVSYASPHGFVATMTGGLWGPRDDGKCPRCGHTREQGMTDEALRALEPVAWADDRAALASADSGEEGDGRTRKV